MMAHLENAAQSAEKHGKPFCVAVIDMDRFKQVNDEYGHQAGDEVLREFARRSAQVLRSDDQLIQVDPEAVSGIGRFGGEEFIAILPGTGIEGALLAAERLRKAISSEPFETGSGPIECTVSIGLTCFRPGEAAYHTVARADRALYNAKDGGRNWVIAAEADAS